MICWIQPPNSPSSDAKAALASYLQVLPAICNQNQAAPGMCSYRQLSADACSQLFPDTASSRPQPHILTISRFHHCNQCWASSYQLLSQANCSYQQLSADPTSFPQLTQLSAVVASYQQLPEPASSNQELLPLPSSYLQQLSAADASFLQLLQA